MSDKKEKAVSEEAKTGASYIAIFNEQLNMLTHWFATYSNLLSYLEHKTGGKVTPETPLDAPEQEQFVNTIHETRFRVEVTNVQFTALKEHLRDKITLSEEEEADILAIVTRLKGKFVIDLVDLEAYVKALHKFILQDIVSDLLKTSKQLVDEVFSEQ